MNLAARSYELTGLGYQGVDLVLDKDKGPLILELNARPGLNIQIANRAGLLTRLQLVEQHAPSLKIGRRSNHLFQAKFCSNQWGIKVILLSPSEKEPTKRLDSTTLRDSPFEPDYDRP